MFVNGLSRLEGVLDRNILTPYVFNLIMEYFNQFMHGQEYVGNIVKNQGLLAYNFMLLN